MTTHTTVNDAPLEKLSHLIKDIKFAMLTTIDAGQLRSRPMAVQHTPFDGDLWFFTGLASPKVHEVQSDSRVNIAFADPDGHRFVSVSGQARLVLDRDKAKELWSPVLKAWFPQGLEDPNLALLKVTIDQAEYWDSASSTMVHLLGLVKAVTTGKASQGEGTDHAKVTLS